MITQNNEYKNIPIAISILHEQEYSNICFKLKLVDNNSKRRRAYSEKNIKYCANESPNTRDLFNINLYNHRCKTLKNQ